MDGLRGLAILLVLLYHFGGYETSSTLEKALRLLTGISFGWSGVDLFFVLSGFLITTILLETRDSPNYFTAFYARRALRIFPVYWGVVLFTFFIALPLAHSLNLAHEMKISEWPWHISYLSNWRSGLGFDIRPLTHFWSLAIEEQFYLVWPCVVLLVPEPGLRRVCLAIVVAVALLRAGFAWHIDNRAIYRFTVFRMDALVLGALVAQSFRDERLLAMARRARLPAMAAGLALVALAGVLSRSPRPYTPWMAVLGYPGWGLAYAGLVFSVADGTGGGAWVLRLLRHGGLRSAGKYGYGMYVVHYPVLMLVHAGVQALAARLGQRHHFGFAWVSIALGVAITYWLATVSWRWLEAPLLRLKRHFPYESGAPAEGKEAAELLASRRLLDVRK